jgi:hypothetical protein
MDKEKRQNAEKSLLSVTLDESTIMCFLEYITTMQFSSQDRLYVAVLIKNKVKKVYGAHSYSSY